MDPSSPPTPPSDDDDNGLVWLNQRFYERADGQKKNATALAAQDLNQGYSKHVFMHKPLRQTPPPPQIRRRNPNNSAEQFGGPIWYQCTLTSAHVPKGL